MFFMANFRSLHLTRNNLKTFYLAITGLMFFLHTKMISMQEVQSAPKMYRQEMVDSKDVADFLVNTTHLHLMALKEGEEAIEKGTVDNIKAYGELMVRDKTSLLVTIRELAQARQVVLPEKLSEDNAKDLERLKAKSGVDFNKAFVKMIYCAHKQALKDFQKAASNLEDKEVSTFASRYISTINLQIIRIEKIKERM